MLIVDDCIISDNLADVRFCCDIKQCKGACCVDGDCGAPLDADEIPESIDYIEIKKLRTKRKNLEKEVLLMTEGKKEMDIQKIKEYQELTKEIKGSGKK